MQYKLANLLQLCFNLITNFQKGEIITIYEKMKHEQMMLDKKISSVKERLKHLPSGKLICSQNGEYQKWYQSDGHKKTYIPKSNKQLAEKLAIKKYLSLLLEDLENEKKAIQSYFRQSTHGKSIQLLTNHSEYQKLLKPYFSPLSEELSNWSNTPYECNHKYPEQLMHKGSSGNYVRSKSESMIDMVLYIHKIPFRYECALTLGETTLFPDFTIRHPQTGEVFYWEHFGLMDNAEYSKNACSKLQLYTNHGIIPSIQLITTYETKEHPLTADVIEKIVEDYFL